jgi:hypothetical protein
MSSAKLTANPAARAQRLTGRPAWKALEGHCAANRNLYLRQLFAEDPRRGEGKALAKRTAAEIASTSEPQLAHDSSTNALIRRYRRLRETYA